MEITEILKKAIQEKVADVFIVSGFAMAYKKNDAVFAFSEDKLSVEDTERIITNIYELAHRKMDKLLGFGDDDFSFSMPDVGRFRCSAYKQRNSLAAVIRIVSFSLPDPEYLGIPSEMITTLTSMKKGLILITGAAGSGKSTTLACIIDKINNTRRNHIITIEDPIEYIHRHNKSIVSQREIKHDTEGYSQALRAALRQAPDVILLGEMRDFETIQTAVTAAETGQLVLSTLHTIGAAKTIDRIIDVFPASQQQQIRVQLSMALQAVVSQQLIPDIDGNIVPAFEVMIVNNAIRNLIRESKLFQIDNVIRSSTAQGMMSMDDSIINLYKQKRITAENVLLYSINQDVVKKRL